jgi:hypothetical protein
MAEANYSTQKDEKLILFRELNTKIATFMRPTEDTSQ